LVLDAGGLALCVWLFVFEGELVCAWFEGVVVWLAGWLVWAWLVELFDDGACAVPVPDWTAGLQHSASSTAETGYGLSSAKESKERSARIPTTS
jgi:hypothetical protein